MVDIEIRNRLKWYNFLIVRVNEKILDLWSESHTHFGICFSLWFTEIYLGSKAFLAVVSYKRLYHSVGYFMFNHKHTQERDSLNFLELFIIHYPSKDVKMNFTLFFLHFYTIPIMSVTTHDNKNYDQNSPARSV